MSRIDEALRRVTEGIGPGDPGSSKTGEQTVRRGDPSVLDHYPREGRGSADRVVSHEHQSPRVISAPRTGSLGRLSPIDSALEGKLILSEQTSQVAVEQYRRVAGAMHELQSERGLKTLMVTSAVPGEGKTLTLANLALTLSESYRRKVLLIDADLRRPSMHEIFKLPNRTGLSACIRSASDEPSLLAVSEHLTVLPAGKPDANPMAGLTSDRMRTLLEESASAFDWVLLDAPPVGLMPDANLLAALTQAVLFVIRAGWTPYALVQRAVEEVGREYIVGTVLNGIDEQSLPSNAYYGHYYAASEESS